MPHMSIYFSKPEKTIKIKQNKSSKVLEEATRNTSPEWLLTLMVVPLSSFTKTFKLQKVVLRLLKMKNKSDCSL